MKNEKEEIQWKESDTHGVLADEHNIKFVNWKAPFLTRLWRLVSNPFMYLFKGEIRY